MLLWVNLGALKALLEKPLGIARASVLQARCQMPFQTPTNVVSFEGVQPPLIWRS